MTNRDLDVTDSISDYLKKFEYSITLTLGQVYSPEFKEFQVWCEQRLGAKYKDWFIVNTGRGEYRLFCRSNKWAMFLALEHVDRIA